MWLWASFTFLFSDPGKISIDLEQRGLLKPILHGVVPKGLRHLPLCPECLVPCPPQSRHCATCRCCFLRRDFHSAFGCCVADRNFKAYFLCLFWGAFLCPAVFLFDFGIAIDCLPLGFSLSLASVWVFWFFIYSAVVFLRRERKDMSRYDRLRMRPGLLVPFRELFDSFGEKWWQKLIPTQKAATKLAWPGVDWSDASCLLSEPRIAAAPGFGRRILSGEQSLW
jgi:hypothetical protein